MPEYTFLKFAVTMAIDTLGEKNLWSLIAVVSSSQ